MRLTANPPGNDPVITAGESAICGLAALIMASLTPAMKKQFGLDQYSRVLLIGSEGITDREVYAQIMQAAQQRTKAKYRDSRYKQVSVEIINKIAEGNCHQDRKLITGDGPQAANKFGTKNWRDTHSKL